MGDRRRPGQRAGLSRTRVLAAAHELLAEDGLNALTMRALARRLEVSPNALYSHVPDRAGLIDALLDDVLSEVTAPWSPEIPASGALAAVPLAEVQAVMASTYQVLLSHPALVPLYLARQGSRGPNAQALGDLVLTRLADADVTGPDAHQALDVLIVYTIGFAAFTSRSGALAREPDPRLTTTSFQDGLHWLLTGIAARPHPKRAP